MTRGAGRCDRVRRRLRFEQEDRLDRLAEQPGDLATQVVHAAAAVAAPLDLTAVLGSAGLTLAATDPEKLRLAQEAAAKAVAPVRKPRERKPLPPQSDEPLIQVNTQRP